MSKNYYYIAIERYFGTKAPFFLLLSLPLFFYGYFESDLCFWIGLVASVLILIVAHLMASSCVRMFGEYATRSQVKYVMAIINNKCEALTENECDKIADLVVCGSVERDGCVDDHIRYINNLLEDRARKGNADANYWLGMYQHHVSKEDGHNRIALQLMEKSAELGSEKAKNMLKKARKWK